jgi:hypothetical protein
MTERQQIPAETLISACPEKSVGLALPVPISDRLDELVRIAEAGGERTTRKEVVASLILAASGVSEELSALLRGYRRADARSSRLGSQSDGDRIAIQSHRPGPRRRRHVA